MTPELFFIGIVGLIICVFFAWRSPAELWWALRDFIAGSVQRIVDARQRYTDKGAAELAGDVWKSLDDVLAGASHAAVLTQLPESIRREFDPVWQRCSAEASRIPHRWNKVSDGIRVEMFGTLEVRDPGLYYRCTACDIETRSTAAVSAALRETERESARSLLLQNWRANRLLGRYAPPEGTVPTDEQCDLVRRGGPAIRAAIQAGTDGHLLNLRVDEARDTVTLSTYARGGAV